MKISSIYKITHIASGRVYVGSAVHTAQRWSEHRSQLRKNAHRSQYMQNAWNKHGENAFLFSVIEEISDLTTLIPREQFWIDLLAAARRPNFNISPTAGSNLGFKHTEKSKAKTSAALMGHKKYGNYIFTDEHKAQVSSVHKGKVVSLETRAKLAAINIGKKHSAATRAKISALGIGRKHTPETKIKMKMLAVWVGRKHSESSKAKMSATKLANKLAKLARASHEFLNPL